MYSIYLYVNTWQSYHTPYHWFKGIISWLKTVYWWCIYWCVGRRWVEEKVANTLAVGNLLTSFRIGTLEGGRGTEGLVKIFGRLGWNTMYLPKLEHMPLDFRICFGWKEFNVTVCEFVRGVGTMCTMYMVAHTGWSLEDFLNSPPGYPWQEI